MTVEQVDDTISVFCIMRRVGDHHDSCSTVIELAKEPHHFGAMSRVKIPRRLVGEDQFRPRDDGSRNGNTLLLSA